MVGVIGAGLDSETAELRVMMGGGDSTSELVVVEERVGRSVVEVTNGGYSIGGEVEEGTVEDSVSGGEIVVSGTSVEVEVDVDVSLGVSVEVVASVLVVEVWSAGGVEVELTISSVVVVMVDSSVVVLGSGMILGPGM